MPASALQSTDTYQEVLRYQDLCTPNGVLQGRNIEASVIELIVREAIHAACVGLSSAAPRVDVRSTDFSQPDPIGNFAVRNAVEEARQTLPHWALHKGSRRTRGTDVIDDNLLNRILWVVPGDAVKEVCAAPKKAGAVFSVNLRRENDERFSLSLGRVQSIEGLSRTQRQLLHQIASRAEPVRSSERSKEQPTHMIWTAPYDEHGYRKALPVLYTDDDLGKNPRNLIRIPGIPADTSPSLDEIIFEEIGELNRRRALRIVREKRTN